MMIQPVNTIQFGQKHKSIVEETVEDVVDVVDEVKDARDEFIAQTVGTGAAATTGVAAVTNGNRVAKALGFAKKATQGSNKVTKFAKEIATNSKNVQQELGKFAQWCSKYKLLKPIVNACHSGPAKFLSGFFAISAAASGVANMINMNSRIIETGKLPSFNLNG